MEYRSRACLRKWEGALSALQTFQRQLPLGFQRQAGWLNKLKRLNEPDDRCRGEELGLFAASLVFFAKSVETTGEGRRRLTDNT